MAGSRNLFKPTPPLCSKSFQGSHVIQKEVLPFFSPSSIATCIPAAMAPSCSSSHPLRRHTPAGGLLQWLLFLPERHSPWVGPKLCFLISFEVLLKSHLLLLSSLLSPSLLHCLPAISHLRGLGLFSWNVSVKVEGGRACCFDHC